MELLGHTVIFNILKNSQTVLQSDCNILDFLSAMYESSNFSTFLQLLISILLRRERYLIVLLTCISLMTNVFSIFLYA